MVIQDVYTVGLLAQKLASACYAQTLTNNPSAPIPQAVLDALEALLPYMPEPLP